MSRLFQSLHLERIHGVKDDRRRNSFNGIKINEEKYADDTALLSHTK